MAVKNPTYCAVCLEPAPVSHTWSDCPPESAACTDCFVIAWHGLPPVPPIDITEEIRRIWP